MIYTIKTINGVKTKVPLTGNGYGLPLGTWISYEGNCPDGFIEAGQSYNTSVYSALYAMLGSNTVPERFDHIKLSDYEDFALSTTNQEMPYDGVMIIQSSNNYTIPTQTVYVNDVSVAVLDFDYGYGGSVAATSTIAFKKGDEIKISNTTNISAKVAYYKKHLAIKATPAYVEPDTVSDMVRTMRVQDSYSTEEVNTGKTWIDGKPIYRKTFSNISYTQNNAVTIDISSLNISEMVDMKYIVHQGNDIYFSDDTSTTNMTSLVIVNNCTQMIFSNTAYFGTVNITIEYTKIID